MLSFNSLDNSQTLFFYDNLLANEKLIYSIVTHSRWALLGQKWRIGLTDSGLGVTCGNDGFNTSSDDKHV